jgi:hypothetical protein
MTKNLHIGSTTVLTTPQRRVFNALLAATGDVVTREQLAEVTGFSASSGHFANILGSLRTLGVVDYPAAGAVSLCAMIEDYRSAQR